MDPLHEETYIRVITEGNNSYQLLRNKDRSIWWPHKPSLPQMRRHIGVKNSLSTVPNKGIYAASYGSYLYYVDATPHKFRFMTALEYLFFASVQTDFFKHFVIIHIQGG